MPENVVSHISMDVPYDEADTDFEQRLIDTLVKMCINFDSIFSYSVKVTADGYNIHIGVSQTEANNTIPVDTFIELSVGAIMADIHCKSGKRYISYGQPPVDMYLELYDNMINSIVTSVHESWPKLEYDDLKQTCYLVILTLYNKGFYLHKNSIKKAFENEVYKSMRNERNAPLLVSLEDVTSMEDDGNMTYQDYLVDDSQDVETMIFRREDIEEQRNIIVKEYGKGFYDTAVFQYGHNMTTPYVRSRIQYLKNKYSRRNV